MSFEQFASIGEFIGGIGVLATLIFLTIEVRKNSRILRANAKTAGMDSFASYNEWLAENPEVSNLFDRILTGESIDTLSSGEQFRLTLAMRAIIQRLEAQYFQFSEGIVEESYWTQRRLWLRSLLDIPTISKWWEVESKSAQLTEEFVSHMNSTPSRFSMGFGGQIDN